MVGGLPFNWSNGNVDLDFNYLDNISFGTMDDAEELSEDAFDEYVEKLKKQKAYSP